MLVKLKGEFVWHHHDVEDELFLVINGHLLINGRRLAEPYVKYSCDWEMDPIKLGSDQYFVVGDNRSMDIHDHKMGPAPRYRIVGKVLL